MIKNFLRLAIRHLYKRKGYSILNILGLTAGITSCLLIFEYVAYERSYDNFHSKADRIVRVQDEEYQNGRLVVPCAAAMPGVAPAMKKEFPEVEDAGRMRKNSLLLSNDLRNVKFFEPGAYFADPAILNIFDLPMVKGDARKALSAPGKVILSVIDARMYFGPEEPIDKTMFIAFVTVGGQALKAAMQNPVKSLRSE